MGGLGPGIGGLEYLLIAAVALIVIGPERLPGVLRKLGKMLGKARRMADEFRNSFDEMARQSELDDLRKEVEALRSNQTMVKLGDEADAAFKDIKTELSHNEPVPTRAERFAQAAGNGVDEWPDTPPVMVPLEPVAEVEPVVAKSKAPARKTAVKAGAAKTSVKVPAKAPASRAKPAKPASATVAKPRSRVIKNSKLDL